MTSLETGGSGRIVVQTAGSGRGGTMGRGRGTARSGRGRGTPGALPLGDSLRPEHNPLAGRLTELLADTPEATPVASPIRTPERELSDEDSNGSTSDKGSMSEKGKEEDDDDVAVNAGGEAPAVPAKPKKKRRPKKKVVRRKPGRPPPVPRETIPLPLPPRPPLEAAPGGGGSRAHRQTASRFVPTSAPHVEDGKDCVIVGTSLKGGTIQKVLEWLVFYETHDLNVTDFVLCFDAFVPLWKVSTILRKLEEAYESEHDKIKLRAFASRLWEARCRDDPGQDGAQALLDLMGSTRADAPTPRRLTLIKEVRARRAAATPAGVELLQGLEIPVRVLAEQMTKMQHDVFQCIPLEELITWPLPAHGMAGYLALLDRALVNWTVLLAVGSPHPSQAARRLLQVCDQLLKLHNYNGLCCVVRGLERASRHSPSLLSHKQQAHLGMLTALVSPAHNYSAFREHLAAGKIAASATVFPIFDAFVGQLQFIHQEQAPYLDQSFINFRKVKLLGALFSLVRLHQRQRYDMQLHAKAWAYVSALCNLPIPRGLENAPLLAASSRLSVLSLDLSKAKEGEADPSSQSPSTTTTNPLRTVSGQKTLQNLLSPRSAALASRLPPSTTTTPASYLPEASVANPLFNPDAQRLPTSIQREAIVQAHRSCLERCGMVGALPAPIQTAIHASRGARLPPVGESVLLPPEEVPVPPVMTPVPPLNRGASLGSGLARVRTALSPRKSPAPSKDEAITVPPLMRSKTEGLNLDNVQLDSPTTTTASYGATSGRAMDDGLDGLVSSEGAVSEQSTHRTDSLISAREREQALQRIEQMEVEEVVQWLHDTAQLSQYEAAFNEHAVNGQALLLLEEADLKAMGIVKVGHRKQLLRHIAVLRSSGLPTSSVRSNAAVDEEEPEQVGGLSTLGRRLAQRAEEHNELYIKGVCQGTVRLMRLPVSPGAAPAELLPQLRDRFRDEFKADGAIVYKDAEGDHIQINASADLDYAIQDAALRGGMVKFEYQES